MPTYEYECTSCGRHIEVFQRITEDPLTTCEACGGQLRKVFHPAGIVFKGSGFYATDSRTSSVPGSSTAKKKDDASSSSSTTSGGDAGSSDTTASSAPSSSTKDAT